jgi:hypothetical protein
MSLRSTLRFGGLIEEGTPDEGRRSARFSTSTCGRRDSR